LSTMLEEQEEEGTHPKPSISVSPSGVIPVGGNVTIRCRHQRLGMRILLYKDGDGNYLNYTDPAGSEAEFPIPSARREHGGSYTCRYSNRTGSAAYSEPSDPVKIFVAGEGPSPAPRLPAPHPARPQGGSLSPGPSRGDGRPGIGDGVTGGSPFHIPTVGRQHGGTYSCSCQLRSEPFILSYYSDPVQLVVTGEGPGSTSPGGVSLGGAVTVRCRGQRWGMRFVLNKERRHFTPVDSVGFQASFPISNVRREDGGSYSCSYHSRLEPFAVSYPSDPVVLVVRGEGPGSASPFPAPPPARPSRVLGANGTLRARLCPEP
uniref:Ig-like domain-containing protein n=1 Tax=Chelydra serpentina TaxID=8475 RepID=A0A8C3S2W9_CHESE